MEKYRSSKYLLFPDQDTFNLLESIISYYVYRYWKSSLLLWRPHFQQVTQWWFLWYTIPISLPYVLISSMQESKNHAFIMQFFLSLRMSGEWIACVVTRIKIRCQYGQSLPHTPSLTIIKQWIFFGGFTLVAWSIERCWCTLLITISWIALFIFITPTHWLEDPWNFTVFTQFSKKYLYSMRRKKCKSLW